MMEPPVEPLKCSEFAQAIINHFDDWTFRLAREIINLSFALLGDAIF
jgi:hypothetical protein